MSEATTLDSPTAQPPPAPAAGGVGPPNTEGQKHEVSVESQGQKHSQLKTYEEGRRAKYQKQFESK